MEKDTQRKQDHENEDEMSHELEEEAEKLDKEAHKLEQEAEKLEKEAHKLEEKADELKKEVHEHEHEHDHDHGHDHEHGGDHGDDFVTITINGTIYKIHRGKYTVLELKTLAHIAIADEFNQVVDGNLIPIPNDGSIHIKGGEIFASNVPSGGSSWR